MRRLLIYMLILDACVAVPAQSITTSNLCVIQDQEAGLCGEAGKVAAFGDAYLDQNYPNAERRSDWSCVSYSPGIWACTRYIRIDYSNDTAYECYQIDYSCGTEEYPGVCRQTICTVSADLTDAP